MEEFEHESDDAFEQLIELVETDVISETSEQRKSTKESRTTITEAKVNTAPIKEKTITTATMNMLPIKESKTTITSATMKMSPFLRRGITRRNVVMRVSAYAPGARSRLATPRSVQVTPRSIPITPRSPDTPRSIPMTPRSIPEEEVLTTTETRTYYSATQPDVSTKESKSNIERSFTVEVVPSSGQSQGSSSRRSSIGSSRSVSMTVGQLQGDSSRRGSYTTTTVIQGAAIDDGSEYEEEYEEEVVTESRSHGSGGGLW